MIAVFTNFSLPVIRENQGDGFANGEKDRPIQEHEAKKNGGENYRLARRKFLEPRYGLPCLTPEYPGERPRQRFIGLEVPTTNKMDVIHALHRLDAQILGDYPILAFDDQFSVFVEEKAFIAS